MGMATLTETPKLHEVALRPAIFADAGMLLAWRNDLQTRAESLNTAEISQSEHESWLRRVLADNGRQLYIAEVNGVAAGTVRADLCSEANFYELSWTVAPQFRGQGVGKVMVKQLADHLAEFKIIARVKPNNRASMSIAIHAGMQLREQRDGVQIYQREPASESMQ